MRGGRLGVGRGALVLVTLALCGLLVDGAVAQGMASGGASAGSANDLAAWSWVLGSAVVIAAMIALPSLRAAVWHARVPVILTVAGALALTVPEQIRYLLAGQEGGSTESTVGGVAALAGAVFATGMGSWFWTRWSLNLASRGGMIGLTATRSQERAWKWLPRIMALAPAVAAFVAIFHASDLMEPTTFWAMLGLNFVVAVSLVGLAFFRRQLIEAVPDKDTGSWPGWRRVLTVWLLHDELRAPDGGGGDGGAKGDQGSKIVRRSVTETISFGWKASYCLALACLPFHPLLVLAMALVSVGSVAVTWSGADLVVRSAQFVGAMPVALFGLASLMTLLAPVAGLMAARRWPALIMLMVWVVGASVANENNFVRSLQGKAPDKPTLAAAARQWLETCSEGAKPETQDIRVALVAAAGGASRAALWAAAVMRALEQGEEGPKLNPATQLFAVSGISGGAVGMAAYVAALDDARAGCGETARIEPKPRLEALSQGLAQDFLSPALAGLFFGDAWWRSLGPVSALAAKWFGAPHERTYWLERGWELATASKDGTPMTGLVAGRTFAGTTLPRLPLLFTAGTHQGSGRLVVTAPVKEFGMGDAMDAMAELTSDISFSVAGSNSARFPVVSAPGQLGRGAVNHIVDGGYHDNLGTTAMLAAAKALREEHAELAKPGRPLYGKKLHLFLVQVWSDPDRVGGTGGDYGARIPRCSDRNPTPDAVSQMTTPLDLVLSPIGALVSARGARANSGTATLVETACGTARAQPDGGTQQFFAFTMGPDQARPGEEKGVKPPLNWVLPHRSQTAIADARLDGFPRLGNREELGRLGLAWNCLGSKTSDECRPRKP